MSRPDARASWRSFCTLSIELSFPENTNLHGFSKPPWGKSLEYCLPPITSHAKTLFLLRNSKQTTDIYSSRHVANHGVSVYNSKGVLVMDVATFPLARQNLTQGSAPNLLVYVVASHDGLQGICSVVPAVAHISMHLQDRLHTLALCTCMG